MAAVRGDDNPSALPGSQPLPLAPHPSPLPALGERGLRRRGMSLLPASGEKVPAGA